MRKLQVFCLGSAALALSMISASLSPMAAYGQAGTGEPVLPGQECTVCWVESPWISIALRHQKDLSLNRIRSLL